MCTAVCYRNNSSYFGRNLDLDRGFGERVVITPRNYPIKMRFERTVERHFAMIGIAAVEGGFPLYFEATNEKGLSVAGLNFPGNAAYYEYKEGSVNVTPFEFIPWILAELSSVDEVKVALRRMNIVNEAFSKELPLTPLHWLISDKETSITVEPLGYGLKVYDNPYEVLTNNPPFDYHRINVSNYMSLSNGKAVSRLSPSIPTENYSLGMGALGLPGDFSSASRFIRALFVKDNSRAAEDESSCVNQFFHILSSVEMPMGCVALGSGFEYTRYSCCSSIERGIYYYKTYDNPEVRAVDMHSTDLDGKVPISILL